jgi:Xaa-Pro aminopeptidase
MTIDSRTQVMSIPRREYEERSVRLRHAMRDESLDALIVFSDEYRSGHGTYLTGYKPINVVEESPQVVIYVEDRPPTVFLGRLNIYAARDVIWAEDVRPYHRAAEFLPEVFRPMRDRPAKVGLIGDNLLPMSLFALIKEALPKASFGSVDRLLIALRQVKTPTEIALMERAADINDIVLKDVVNKVHVGMTEMQVAGLVEGPARELNADIGSATVVMSGPNSNYAAWRPTDRKIERGDFVLIDFNPAVGHYCNDGGITVLMPGASSEQVDALTAGHWIIKEIVPLLRPHTSARTVHDLMLERLAPLGYGPNFTPYVKGLRGVGHGVGVDVVEMPNLSSESNFQLLPGMTLALKLDLHGMRAGGYRVEVVVLFTEDSVRPLNKMVLSEVDDFAILR